jgi:hypothetical protein
MNTDAWRIRVYDTQTARPIPDPLSEADPDLTGDPPELE